MKNYLRWVTLAGACIAMGMSMPSCPGQQAMQQQIDALQASNADLTKKVQALTTQVNTLSNDMNQVKQLMPQVTNVIQAQKTALDQLDASVKEIQARFPKSAKKKK